MYSFNNLSFNTKAQVQNYIHENLESMPTVVEPNDALFELLYSIFILHQYKSDIDRTFIRHFTMTLNDYRKRVLRVQYIT
jgi:hypothetical protein